MAGWTAVVSSSPGGGGDAEHLLEKCSICLQHDHTPIGGGAAGLTSQVFTVLSRDGVRAAGLTSQVFSLESRWGGGRSAGPQSGRSHVTALSHVAPALEKARRALSERAQREAHKREGQARAGPKGLSHTRGV